MAPPRKSPIADDLDPAPRILRLIAATLWDAGSTKEETQKFAREFSRRLIKTARILERHPKEPQKLAPGHRWTALAYLERREETKAWRDSIAPPKRKPAPKRYVPLTAQERALLAELEAEDAARAAAGAAS
jgi:hypothetical protein